MARKLKIFSRLILSGTTNTNANANTLNAILFPNVTPVANNAFYGLSFGTGYGDIACSVTRSAQPWLQPAPGAQCFETQPNGWGSLLPGWRARWADPAD